MFELIFLGTAATTPSPERGLAAVLVSAGSERFLVDCGEGTQRQLLRSGAGFRRLGHILLTHTHLDHVLGLGGLLATLGLFDLRGDVAIYGSHETVGFVARSIWPASGPAARPRRRSAWSRSNRGRSSPVRARRARLSRDAASQSAITARKASDICSRRPGAAICGPSGSTRSAFRRDKLRARLAAGEAVVLPMETRVAPEEVAARDMRRPRQSSRSSATRKKRIR